MTDLHTHTIFCDGAASPEEMAAAALQMGLDCLGFSGHSHTWFDESYCMSPRGTEAYRQRIGALKREYAGKMRILCGVEQDFWSEAPTQGYDYVIGSVHYLKLGDEFRPVDESPEISAETVERYFGGDWYAMAEAYFDTVARVVDKTGCDIIGHFDLVAKFNEKAPAFDETHPRYAAAWQSALDALLPSGRLFEINTGAVSRGWRTTAYPRPEMIGYILDHGGRLILSSDSHSPDTLCFGFSGFEKAYPALHGNNMKPFSRAKTVEGGAPAWYNGAAPKE